MRLIRSESSLFGRMTPRLDRWGQHRRPAVATRITTYLHVVTRGRFARVHGGSLDRRPLAPSQREPCQAVPGRDGELELDGGQGQGVLQVTDGDRAAGVGRDLEMYLASRARWWY